MLTVTTASAATSAAAAEAAAAAGATSATTTTEAATATTTGARLLRTRFVDSQRTAVHLFAVHIGNGFFSFFVSCEFDESKTLRPARVAISDDASGLDGTERAEPIVQRVFGDRIREIANIQFFTH